MNAKQHELFRYDTMCDAAAAQVIKKYSTSFHATTRLFPAHIRRDIRNLYAVVRIADEIVDGAHEQAYSMTPLDRLPETKPQPKDSFCSSPEFTSGHEYEARCGTLDSYQARALAAPQFRFHTDPILHAYANTARRCGFNNEHLRAFFASMRMDITHTSFNDEALAAYIYGSAEVIGLLCLDIFYADQPQPTPEQYEFIRIGAQRLGAGFQKVNFLRDYNDDLSTRQRDYYPALRGEHRAEALTDLLEEIRADLHAGEQAIALLPVYIQPAVLAATLIYRELVEILTRSPEIVIGSNTESKRVSVPNHRKLGFLARSLTSCGLEALETRLPRLRRK